MQAYADPESALDRAFEGLYRRYVQDVYRYALALLRNPSDAEDVTQTTFLNAYVAFQRGVDPRKPHHWLIKIAHNACRSRYVRTARRPAEVPLDERLAQLPVASEGAIELPELLAALHRLPFNQRAALVMRELEGSSYLDIAETLGVTVPAVETLIFRARRRLRADRSTLQALGAVPLPSSLASFFEGGGALVGGGAAVGSGLALKAALVVAAGVVAGSMGSGGPSATASPSGPTHGSAIRAPAGLASSAPLALRVERATVRLVRVPATALRAGGTAGASRRTGRAAVLPAGARHAGAISVASQVGAAGASAAAGRPSGPAPAIAAAAPAASAAAPESSAPAGSRSSPPAPPPRGAACAAAAHREPCSSAALADSARSGPERAARALRARPGCVAGAAAASAAEGSVAPFRGAAVRKIAPRLVSPRT